MTMDEPHVGTYVDLHPCIATPEPGCPQAFTHLVLISADDRKIV
jgi:hypothetical protein